MTPRSPRVKRFAAEANRQRPEDRKREQFRGACSGTLPEEIRRQLEERSAMGVAPTDGDDKRGEESDRYIAIAQ